MCFYSYSKYIYDACTNMLDLQPTFISGMLFWAQFVHQNSFACSLALKNCVVNYNCNKQIAWYMHGFHTKYTTNKIAFQIAYLKLLHPVNNYATIGFPG